MELKPGTQVAYVPTHAKGDLNHRDVQFGFVTKDAGEDAFCRYWQSRDSALLRTTSNSERTPKRLLVLVDSHSQKSVEFILAGIRLGFGG